MKKMLSALLSTVLLLSLFGCGAAMNSGASADTQTNGFAFSDQNKYESSMGFDSAAPMEPESAAPGYNAVETPSSSLPENVKMIYRGYLHLESTAFDEAVEGLNQLVAKMGGYFESSELNNYSPYRSACYVVRVPSAKYNKFCGQVGGLAQLNSQRHTTENVSEAYYDTESRLLTQRTKLERLQELLAKAENMEDIITLESAIADTELNIEYLTGTLRKYDALVDYATVEITLEEVYVLSEQEQPVTGFWPRLAQAFSTGTARFVDDVQDFALGFARNWVGSLIWLAVIAAVIVLLVRWLRKGKKPLFSRRKKKAPAPPPAEGSGEDHK